MASVGMGLGVLGLVWLCFLREDTPMISIIRWILAARLPVPVIADESAGSLADAVLARECVPVIFGDAGVLRRDERHADHRAGQWTCGARGQSPRGRTLYRDSP